MSVLRRRERLRALAIATALAAVLALVHAPSASAASVRLQVWEFNACDQFGRGNAECEVTPTQRAGAIAQSINSTSWPPNVVTLQELCRSTFDMVVDQLSSSWVAYFQPTYTTTDTRCQSAETGWGIAVFAKSGVLSNPSTSVLGVETSGERRTLLCIDVTVTVPVRTCTTHLTATSQATAASQARTSADLVNQWVAAGTTVVVGGDFNLNARQCSNSFVRDGLRSWYYGRFGAGSRLCYSGVGSMYEADHYRSGGDGVYDEDTYRLAKIDYVFGNRQRVNADYGGDATSSSVSDHDPLRAAMTAHD
jgi:endonuclease/exonuclease/phosphatase family metal-dependent hydrolase